jgi:hypothetical protein
VALNQVLDADRTHFTGLVADVVDKYPHDYGDIVSLFYFCTKTKVNIQVRSDQDLVEMFAKHRAFITAMGLDGVVFVPARTAPSATFVATTTAPAFHPASPTPHR